MSELVTAVAALEKNVAQALLGKHEAIRLAVAALLAEGHLLVEDAPGVGKTSLAKAIAKSLNCEFTRLQFTPDMLPSDILGSSIFLPNMGEFEFRRGPIFTNILLADEINRTTPRTQSALLEAMSEGQVSLEGKTYPLASPFFVLATQNPFEFEGTYPLPENQLDRFMMCIEVGYPAREVEIDILRNHRLGEPVDQLKPVITAEQLRQAHAAVREVKLDDALYGYLLDIVHATRAHEQLQLGVSPRGAITFFKAVQSLAYLAGRNYVVPDDIKHAAVPVLAHRVVCKGMLQESQRSRAQGVIRQILSKVPVPT